LEVRPLSLPNQYRLTRRAFVLTGGYAKLSWRPGSNVTLIALTRAGSGASTIGSCHTVPVKYSEDAFFVGRVPDRNMSIMLSLLSYIGSKEDDSNIRLCVSWWLLRIGGEVLEWKVWNMWKVFESGETIKRRLAIYDQPVQQGGMSLDTHELSISL